MSGAGLLLALSLACNPPKQKPTEICIGLIVPLSGSTFADVGRPAQEGAQLAVRVLNDRGGLRLGQRRVAVRLAMEDDDNRPELALQAARKLINQDGAVALVGPLLSRTAIAVATVAEQMRTPMISPTATAAELTLGKQFVFRATFVDSLQGQALARFARQDLGALRAAALFDVASLHNRNIAEIFRRTFEKAGGKMVAYETYTTGEQVFTLQLEHIRAAEPDVLLLPNYFDEVPNQVRQARELGIQATFLGSDAWDGDHFPHQAEFNGSYFTDDWQMGIANLESAESRAFDHLYRSTIGGDPPSLAAVVYDAFGILFAAIEHSGSSEGPAIRQGLASLANFRGVTGFMSFQGHGDPLKSIFIFNITDGRVVFSKRILP